jgi:hypothetical protein
MTNHNIGTTMAIIGCVALLWSLAGAQNTKTYEIRPQIPESLFKTESARAMDAYERMVDRTLELNARQLDAMDLNIKEVSKQLYRVEAKLDQLLDRSILVEYALGISHVRVEKSPAAVQPEDPNMLYKENGS